jgi:hypothetical protein
MASPTACERRSHRPRAHSVGRSAAAREGPAHNEAGGKVRRPVSTLVAPTSAFASKHLGTGWNFLAGNFRRELTMTDFGDALELLKAGKRVARAGWNGKGMFLFLVPGSIFTVSRPPLLGIYPEGTRIDYHAHIDMKTAQGYVVPWVASQADVLADDWSEVSA